jgi:hypothetical protein
MGLEKPDEVLSQPSMAWIFVVILSIFAMMSMAGVGLLGYYFLKGTVFFTQFFIGIWTLFMCLGLPILLSMITVKCEQLFKNDDKQLTVSYLIIFAVFFLILGIFSVILSKSLK